jgi:hypothetical protein
MTRRTTELAAIFAGLLLADQRGRATEPAGRFTSSQKHLIRRASTAR